MLGPEHEAAGPSRGSEPGPAGWTESEAVSRSKEYEDDQSLSPNSHPVVEF